MWRIEILSQKTSDENRLIIDNFFKSINGLCYKRVENLIEDIRYRLKVETVVTYQEL